MKRHLLLILIPALLTGFSLKAQNFSKEFGVIDKEEILLKDYPPDKEAEAVVLFDIGKSSFIENLTPFKSRYERRTFRDHANSFDIVFEKMTRIKILSEQGVKWADVEIPFYRDGDNYEKITGIEAYAYNYTDGRLIRTKLDASSAVTVKMDENLNVIKFQVPAVKPGSVIEYRYKLRSPYPLKFRDWNFQWKIPVIYSEYEVRMVPFYEYAFILQGAEKFDSFISYEDRAAPRQFGSSDIHGKNDYYDMVYKFIMKDVPGFRDEEFISSVNDYIIRIDFQLSGIKQLDKPPTYFITTWEDMISDLSKNKDFGKYVNKSGRTGKKCIPVKELNEKDETERFNYVLDYVKSNFTWDENSDKMASKSPASMVEEKTGNSADLNLFAIGLLNDAGIDARPLILSTRDHGKIKQDYPFNHFFNYVIIKATVDGKTVLSDATDPFCLNNRIPARCINDKGLVIRKDTLEWINLECLYPSLTSTFLQMKISSPDILEVNLLKQATEYDALSFRHNYSDPGLLKQKLIPESYSLVDSTFIIQNQTEKTKPWEMKYSLTIKPEMKEGNIYISPFLFEVLTENPLKQKTRNYPLDMLYPREKIFNTTLTIPEGYELVNIPGPVKIDNELFALNYKAQVHDNAIRVLFDYTFKESVYHQNNYTKLKYYFNEIVKKGNEQIVLKKRAGISSR